MEGWKSLLWTLYIYTMQKVDLEFTLGLMEELIKAIGIVANNMERERKNFLFLLEMRLYNKPTNY